LRIGVFGGSFNPVHRGHLRLAEVALSELDLERVLFVPAARNPLKVSEDLLPGALRVRLLKTALRKHPAFAVEDFEVRRGGVSYTVDTLRHLKKKFGTRAVLYFLCGADALRSFSRWKSPDKVLKLSRFVAVTRPGHRWSKRGMRAVQYLPMDALDVSASDIRKRLERGLSVRQLVPEGTMKILQDYYKRKKVLLRLAARQDPSPYGSSQSSLQKK
jgi:nicotinate-nucleotide adenylyltransferase